VTTMSPPVAGGDLRAKLPAPLPFLRLAKGAWALLTEATRSRTWLEPEGSFSRQDAVAERFTSALAREIFALKQQTGP